MSAAIQSAVVLRLLLAGAEPVSNSSPRVMAKAVNTRPAKPPTSTAVAAPKRIT